MIWERLERPGNVRQLAQKCVDGQRRYVKKKEMSVPPQDITQDHIMLTVVVPEYVGILLSLLLADGVIASIVNL
jgi:hypothetical protein